MKSIFFVILTLINTTPESQHGITLNGETRSYKIEAIGPRYDYRIKPGIYTAHIETDAAVFIYGIEICEGDSVDVNSNLQIRIEPR